jgi:hypothetical protein
MMGMSSEKESKFRNLGVSQRKPTPYMLLIIKKLLIRLCLTVIVSDERASIQNAHSHASAITLA